MYDKVLLVCQDNLAHSLIAESFFKHHFESNQIDCHVDSAGISIADNPASKAELHWAEHALKVHQIEMSDMEPKQLTQAMLKDYDLVLVMNTAQQIQIETLYPFIKGRIKCLGCWSDIDIIGPEMNSVHSCENVVGLIKQCVQDWTSKIWAVEVHASS